MAETNSLPRSTPEAQGISSTALSAFVNEVNETIHELHSFMLLRHGQVVAEGWWSPYGAGRPHMLFSLSKSFTSSAIGLAVEEGRLSIDDPVASFFPHSAPAKLSRNQAAMRIRHLLSMSTGHAKDTTARMVTSPDGDWVTKFLSLPVQHTPGTHFVYNSGATYMLSAILQKVTGQTVLEYLRPRLFEPLGIAHPTWESCPRGINTGGWGLSIRTEDIARFGQMYLQLGRWNGQQIIPTAWVKEATAFQVANAGNKPGTKNLNSDWQQGYGYQFWRCRHGAYRGDGAFGQYCVVMPDQEAVLAITGSVKEMQPVLDLAWKHILPAMQPSALPADPAAVRLLAQQLDNLALQPPKGTNAPALAAVLSGKHFTLAENKLQLKTIAFEFSPAGCVLTLVGLHGEQRIACGSSRWEEGHVALLTPNPMPYAASAAWKSPRVLSLTVRLVETPFYQAFTCRFEGDQVRVRIKPNRSMGPARIFDLAGKL